MTCDDLGSWGVAEVYKKRLPEVLEIAPGMQGIQQCKLSQMVSYLLFIIVSIRVVSEISYHLQGFRHFQPWGIV